MKTHHDTTFDFSRSMTKPRLANFADYLLELQDRIGFKISSRGWCYQLEGERRIDKDQFDKVEMWINRCRREGALPVDFVAEEEGRKFSGVDKPTQGSPIEHFGDWLSYAMRSYDMYHPDWWEGETYYIQMVVEKIDLKTLFSPVCQRYHIPIATSKGWSSMLQRAEYARRFQMAEQDGLKCVLLYCGDHDPDGLRISNFINSNLDSLKNVTWGDGAPGYDPANLTIERFGLNADFIQQHRLTWIDNLITGGKKNLADPRHKNYHMEYVQTYLKDYGERKCEANAIVTIPTVARELVDGVILGYLGDGAAARLRAKRLKVKDAIETFQEETGLKDALDNAMEIIRLHTES